jgi:hypothetical protein
MNEPRERVVRGQEQRLLGVKGFAPPLART